jgi:hypothetical protein
MDGLVASAADFETRNPNFTESLLGVRCVFTELLNPVVKVGQLATTVGGIGGKPTWFVRRSRLCCPMRFDQYMAALSK